MAINYNLNIGTLGRKLSVDQFSNVVYEVNVGVYASSQEYSQFNYSCSGTIQFDTTNLTDESFVPFEEITQETIINWLLQKEGVESIEQLPLVKYSIQNIQQRIDDLQVEDTVSVSWAVSGSSDGILEESQETEETEETDPPVQEDILEP